MMYRSDGPDGAPVSGIRLLLVDPDPEVRAELRRGLIHRFEVVEASNTVEALFRLAARWFNVVLTDYELGDHDGVWLLEQISKKHPHMWRVLMSNRAVPNVRGLQDAGVFQLFLAKPVEPEVFSAYFVTPT